MLVLLEHGKLKTLYGLFDEWLFYDGLNEVIALTCGHLQDKNNIPCRVHSSCISAHSFNSIECDCREQMISSQKYIQDSGIGIIILLNQEGRGYGHWAKMKSCKLKEEGMSQSEAYYHLGLGEDSRNYMNAARVTTYLEVQSIILLSGNIKKAEQLRLHGVTIDQIKDFSSVIFTE